AGLFLKVTGRKGREGSSADLSGHFSRTRPEGRDSGKAIPPFGQQLFSANGVYFLLRRARSQPRPSTGMPASNMAVVAGSGTGERVLLAEKLISAPAPRVKAKRSVIE